MRPLHEVADEIWDNWGENVWFGARPYLEAMSTLNSINEDFGYDSGQSIVLYFLANAQTWRGEVARRVKKELKGMAGIK